MNSGQVCHATRSGLTGAWQVETVDGSMFEPALGAPVLAARPDGSPAVCYFTALLDGRAALKYATRTSGAWTAETAAYLAIAGTEECCLGVRPSGAPLIAYHEPLSGTLTCARKGGEEWISETVDSAPQTGYAPSLAIDGFGNAHVSYFDYVNFNVSYAWSATPLADAKLLADGQQVEVFGVIATTATGELASKVYVQNLDRTAGIQVCFTGEPPAVSRGSMLDVRGEMATVDGERVIVNPVVQEIGMPVE